MMSFAFPRSLRLLTPSDFQRVFNQTGLKTGGKHLLFLARENGLEQPRLGLVIARKRVRRAVDRALIKRHLRESFRLRQAALAGLDVVVLLRANLRDPDPRTLRPEIDALWDKLLAKREQA
ncbi:ribonuclease P protein component [Isoalcanivorax indicus]|uniref:ribonuclease P protein component n=1 Tax=Isoalcanivorax indicus TaxID=2202653 RepID=UPI000DB99483|nr:ribonuclease P protein component [Isoalcanivorax indicus]